MKQFSLPLYYVKFFFYLLASFVLTTLFSTGFSLLSASRHYAGLIGLGFGLIIYSLGFWNLFFFAFALPPEQAFKPKVWLGSILFPPALLMIPIILIVGLSDPSYIGYVLSSGFWPGTILSNAIFYAIGYAAAKFRQRQRAESELEKEQETHSQKEHL